MRDLDVDSLTKRLFLYLTGDVIGQFPMNFSDVKPEFMVSVSSNKNVTSGTRKFGYPFHYTIGILTPTDTQHVTPPQHPGPQQPYVS